MVALAKGQKGSAPSVAPKITEEKDPLNTSSSATAEKTATKITPDVAASHSIKKDILTKMTPADRVALDKLLEKDDRFRDIFAIQPVGRDQLIAKNVILPPEVESQFTKNGRAALKTMIAGYGSYLAPFVTVQETEPFTSLLNYMTSKEHNWDMRVTYDKSGIINGGTCGRQFPVLYKGQTVRAAWIEHTWTHPDIRHKGLGTKLYKDFEKNCETDPQAVVIEIDNPRALNKAPRFHNMRNPEARTAAWIKDGQTMDPYYRNDFWGKQEFRIVCIPTRNGPRAINYIQIAMDPSNMEEGGYCDTMYAGIKIRDKSLITGHDKHGNPEISPGLYKAMYPAVQATIDNQLHLYPEFIRTMKVVNDVETPLVLVDARTKAGRAAIARLAKSLDPIAETAHDIKFCRKMLRSGALDKDERALVRDHLKRAQMIRAEALAV